MGSPSAFPSWLAPEPPSTAIDGLNEVSFVVHSPLASNPLLLTLFFDEKANGFLRVIRKDPSGNSRTLTGDLFEGTGLRNRRTLLLDAPIPDGTIVTFQASGPTTPLLRLLWQWTSSKTVVATGNEDDIVALADHRALTEAETSPSPLPPPPVEVRTGYTATPLLPQPLAVPSSGGVILAPVFDQLPLRTRLEGKFTGLAPNTLLECRVNDVKIGYITALPPSLKDLSWTVSPDGASPAGWQTGAIVIPATAWKAGGNKVELVPVAAGSEIPLSSPFALKDLYLEAVYGTNAGTVPPVSSP